MKFSLFCVLLIGLLDHFCLGTIPFYILNQRKGCLTAFDNGEVYVTKCVQNATNQIFHYGLEDDNHLVSAATAKCLDVEHYGSNGARIIQYTCKPSKLNQQWYSGLITRWERLKPFHNPGFVMDAAFPYDEPPQHEIDQTKEFAPVGVYLHTINYHRGGRNQRWALQQAYGADDLEQKLFSRP